MKKNQFIGLVQHLQNLQADIKGYVPVQSGYLRDNIETKVVMKDYGINIQVLMPEYGEYQDKGVSGILRKFNTPYSYSNKRPPESAFIPYYPNSLSDRWRMSNIIYLYGIQPTNFTAIVDDYLDDIYDGVIEGIWDDFDI